MNIKTYRFVTVFSAIIASQSVFSDTHYVATTGVNTGTGTSACTISTSPCLTLQFAIDKMSSGDTLSIANGTYSGTGNDLNNSIPNGTPGAYTVIQALTDGGVEITSDFTIGSNSTRKSFIEFRGLKINSALGKSIIGHHIKVFRTAFQGGPNGDNTTNLGIGTIGPTTGTPIAGADHILLEDVWSYGFGGRYNILIYNCEDVIIRRAVIRHDGGWTVNVSSNPEAGITIYDSQRVQLQNVIVLDSIADSPNWTSAFYNVHNNSNNQMPHDMTRTVGSMAINNNNNNSPTGFPCNSSPTCTSYGTGFAWDDSLTMTNAVLENSVAYNSGTSLTSNGADKFVTVTGVTIYGGNGTGIAKYGNGGAFTISNTVIYNKTSNAFNSGISTSDTTNVLCFGNGGGTTACDTTNTDPASGMLYLPRTESGSYLANNNIGVNIAFRTGTSGTYYGDAGYNIDTIETLWPWPYQERIFADMCGVRNSALCSAGTLTNYIWGLLGNSVPTEFSPMPAPVNVRITKN